MMIQHLNIGIKNAYKPWFESQHNLKFLTILVFFFFKKSLVSLLKNGISPDSLTLLKSPIKFSFFKYYYGPFGLTGKNVIKKNSNNKI